MAIKLANVLEIEDSFTLW